MTTSISPTQEYQMKRRLSIDAEDELFKSLQGVQELNNSQRQRRTIGSPGNHSGRFGRRTSIDGTMTGGSPGNYSCGVRRRKSIDQDAALTPSGRRDRRSVEVKSASPGVHGNVRRQRRSSINNGVSPKQNNSGRTSDGGANINTPMRNNSGKRNGRSLTPPRGLINAGAPLSLDRQTSGGTVRKPNRMRRRGSTGPENSPGVIATTKAHRTGIRRSEPDRGRTKPEEAAATASSPGLVIRSFNRRRVMNNTSPNHSPPVSPKEDNVISPSSNKSPQGSKVWAEMLKTPKPPRLENSTTSWASFSIDSDFESNDASKSVLDASKPDISEGTESTEPMSDRERNSCHSDERAEQKANLASLLEQLKDPAEIQRRRMEREEKANPKLGAAAQTCTDVQHDKVHEQSSSRNLKNFLMQRSKRGYGQQDNLDGLSVMQ